MSEHTERLNLAYAGVLVSDIALTGCRCFLYVRGELDEVKWRQPVVAANALSGPKFSAALPPGLAARIWGSD